MRVLMILMMLLAGPVAADPVRDIIPMVNAFRAQNGLGPVRADRKLETAAERHVTDMEANRFFDHKGSDGSTLARRLKRVRYRYCAAAENIAYGHESSADVLQGWINSPGHRRNLLAPVIHIGVARGVLDRWVMVLAAPMGKC